MVESRKVHSAFKVLVTASVFGNAFEFTASYLIRPKEIIHAGNFIIWTPTHVRNKNRVCHSAHSSTLSRLSEIVDVSWTIGK